MVTPARAVYLDSQFGMVKDLPRAGSALENPFLFDEAARELKSMAEAGLVEIVDERSERRADETLITRLAFKRLR
jgi:hypothetical protein